MKKTHKSLSVAFRCSLLVVAMASASSAHATYLHESHSVGDRIWIDRNEDGIQNVGEAGADRVTVTINDCDTGAELLSTYTDRKGRYSLSYIAAGLEVRAQAYPDSNFLYDGAGYSPKGEGSDSLKDSDGSKLAGSEENLAVSECFSTTAGGKSYGLDFGLVLSAAGGGGVPPGPKNPGTVGDLVWIDSNGNGQVDVGERGLEGATLDFYNTATGNLEDSATTDASGKYLLDLPSTCYRAMLTLPASVTGTPTVTDNNREFCLAPEETNRDIDFSVTQDNSSSLATLGDLVWYDDDQNDAKNGAETGAKAVRVDLFDTATNSLETTVYTDENGAFSASVPEACYRVEVTLPGEIVGYIVSDNNREVCLTSGQTNNTVDIALDPVAVVSDATLGERVWVDTNFNETFDAGESGLPGAIVEVRLTSSDALVSTKTTNASGEWEAEVGAGCYTVTATTSDAGLEIVPSSRSVCVVGAEVVRNLNFAAQPSVNGLPPTQCKVQMYSGANLQMHWDVFDPAFTNEFIAYDIQNDLIVDTTGKNISRYHGWGDRVYFFPVQPYGSHSTQGVRNTALMNAMLEKRVHTARRINADGSLSPASPQCKYFLNASPIGIDLDKRGSVTKVSTSVNFDIDGDGDLDMLDEWFSPGTGILINTRLPSPLSGVHLFGDQGGLYADGYAKLAQHDIDKDGVLRGIELDGLAVWIDDGDAMFVSTEAKSLASAGVVELSVEHVDMVSNALMNDGSRVMSKDLWFDMQSPE